MNDREALLTGTVAGVLTRLCADPDSPYTYSEIRYDADVYENRISVVAADGVTFTVTVEQDA